MKKIEKAIAGVLGGTVLAAFLFISDDALAYEQFTGTEGKQIQIKIKLPTFPHEARQRSRGYKGVRYEICTRDGTAKGGTWSGYLFGGGGSYTPGTDYLNFCGYKVEFTSHNNYSKSLKLTWPTADDDVKEDNEYFWIDLTNPQVMRAGKTTWEDWNGSHHVPSKIEVQAIIEDND